MNLDFPVVFDDDGTEENFSGMTFSQLPEWAQDRIKDYSLTVYYYEDMTEEEVREFFRRLNNGKPLSATELTRVKAVSLPMFQHIAEHPAIQTVVSDKDKARFNHENIAFQIAGLAFMENPDFGTKAFRPWIESVSLDSEKENQIISGLDYVNDFLTYLDSEDLDAKEVKRISRKIKSRTHFVAMAYFGMLCALNDVEQEEYNTTVCNFFNCSSTTTSNEYNSTIGSGSAKAEAVTKRKNVVDSMMHDMLVNA